MEDKKICNASPESGLTEFAPMKSEMDESWRNGLNSMEDRWATILKTNLKDQFPHDATFCVGTKDKEQLITCHKFVVSLASPVLQKLIQCAEYSGEKIIKLTDVDPEIFKILLQHVYLEELFISDQQLIDTMILAKQFGIPDIINQYTDQLRKNISKGNCVTIFQTANDLSILSLKADTHDFIIQNFGQILDSEDFLKFTEKNLCEILMSDDLEIVSELELFKAVQIWGENQCKAQGIEITEPNVREVIKTIVPNIGFLTMTLEEFVTSVEPTNLLYPEDTLTLFKYFAIRESKWTPCHQMFPEKFSKTWRISKLFEKTVALYVHMPTCGGAIRGEVTICDGFQLTGVDEVPIFLQAVGFLGHPKYPNREVKIKVTIVEEQKPDIPPTPEIILAKGEHIFTVQPNILSFVKLAKPLKICAGKDYLVIGALEKGRISTMTNSLVEAIVFEHPRDSSKSVNVIYKPNNACLCALKFSHQE